MVATLQGLSTIYNNNFRSNAWGIIYFDDVLNPNRYKMLDNWYKMIMYIL
jgi:hypothetical protein